MIFNKFLKWIHLVALLWVRFLLEPVTLALLSTCDFFGEKGVCGSLPDPKELPSNILHIQFQGLANDLLKQISVSEVNSWYPHLETFSCDASPTPTTCDASPGAFCPCTEPQDPNYTRPIRDFKSLFEIGGVWFKPDPIETTSKPQIELTSVGPSVPPELLSEGPAANLTSLFPFTVTPNSSDVIFDALNATIELPTAASSPEALSKAFENGFLALVVAVIVAVIVLIVGLLRKLFRTCCAHCLRALLRCHRVLPDENEEVELQEVENNPPSPPQPPVVPEGQAGYQWPNWLLGPFVSSSVAAVSDLVGPSPAAAVGRSSSGGVSETPINPQINPAPRVGRARRQLRHGSRARVSFTDPPIGLPSPVNRVASPRRVLVQSMGTPAPARRSASVDFSAIPPMLAPAAPVPPPRAAPAIQQNLPGIVAGASMAATAIAQLRRWK